MTISAATLTAPCKINLNLSIVDVRQDGFHELDTLFLPVPDPADILEVEPGDGFSLRCPGHESIEGPDNLVAKAWRAYREATGFAPGIRVTLHKHIPMGAGLGGGSTDAAALLRWLNEAAGEAALSADALNELAARLGADVPFFLKGVPARAAGIGERLQPCDVSLKGLNLLIITPEIHVNTAWAYREWDRVCLPKRRKTTEPLTSGNVDNKNSVPARRLHVHNDFEDAIFPEFPTIRKEKENLYRHGACAAAMSGSGASVFAFFRSGVGMSRAAEDARRRGLRVWENGF
ncbi:4-(cytidine 5'-diphospho)-2-C-methyl-D-erythritol kinase [Salidesulfovibrio brasiliensis]|uniref:4-(cytidine 5'-diphospho)-2-C-methyl-D-erythritol kinase n=1 Tax=Salidesulfovibrio brasiliensis TaxID=221711 RepID=UPI0006D0776D|nr:4-(cytidine 5'-diphospho)-2-C-methyl-D-erythritol kinase [Salidesulfovibrio brasiliensis]